MKRGSMIALGVISVGVALCMGVSLAACSTAHVHSWDDGNVTQEATCTEDGTVIYTCLACGQTKTGIIEATGHTYVDFETTANCMEGGYTTYVCSKCGDKYTDKETEPLGHTHEKTDTPVTYVNGSAMYECSRCGEKYVAESVDSSDDSWLDSAQQETGEDGSTITTYEVSNASQLANFADYVNEEGNAMKDSVIELTSDIDLEDKEWTPIGNTAYNDDGYDSGYTETEAAFLGTFDGNDCTISNLRVDAATSYGGLFGYIYGATIENVNIDGAVVNGGQDVGALVGNSGDTADTVQATISNCHVTGLIQMTADHFVGGLVGRAETTVIENCSVEGDAGSFIKGEYVKDNYEGDAVGGLIGFIMNRNPEAQSHNYQYSKISDVTVSGLDISGSRKVGGLVGNLCDNNNLAVASKDPVITSSTGSVNTIKNCTISITEVKTDDYTKTEDEAGKLFAGAIIGEVTGYSTKIENCEMEGVTVNYINANCVYGVMTGDAQYKGYCGGTREDGLEVTFTGCSGTVKCVGKSGESDNSWLDTKTTTGEGDDAVDTYTVSTAAQLMSFAEYVNGYGTDSDMSDAVIELEEDIDLKDVDWTPIGDGEYDYSGYENTHNEDTPVFSGTFDGQGHTISNLSITADDETNNVYAGLFGYIYGATIENVTIENATVTGGQDVGALVGNCGDHQDTVQATISNCHVKGVVQITGEHFVGGLMGRAEGAVVENCSVEATGNSYVKGVYAGEDYEGDSVGGLAGFFQNSKTENYTSRVDAELKGVSVSGLDISGSRKVGGIVGNISSWGDADDGYQIMSAYAYTDDNGDTQTVKNSISNCTISIVIVEEDGYTDSLITGSSIKGVFAGAIYGELTDNSISISDCEIGDGVVVYAYSEDYIYTGTTDEEGNVTGTEYAGFYGGTRPAYSYTTTLASCTGTVTIHYLTSSSG